MNKKIVDILNNVLSQSGFLVRPTFFNSADPDDLQMAAIANRVLLEVAGFYGWSSYRVPYQIDLQEGQELYPLPSDLKWIIGDSSWETDGSRKVDDHISDNEWYQYKFSSLTSGGIIRARVYGNNLEVQEPFVGGQISFEYITEYAVTTELGQMKEEFDNDADLFILDDQLLTLGVQAHWAETKMLPQADKWGANYMQKMNEAISRDGVRNTIGGTPQQLRRSPYTKTWVN
jgi:hypothetical protein